MAKGVVLVYPTHGHIAPALGVVSELVRRGEDLVFYGTGRSRCRIESTGAEFCLYGRRHDEFNPSPPTEGLFSDMDRLAALTEEILPTLVEQLERESPDYLLVDTKSLWGRLVGQILGIPAITLSVVFAIRPGVVRVPDLVDSLYGGAAREKLLEGMTALSRYGETARSLSRRYRTRAPGIIDYLGNPHPLNIIFTSREFQLQGEEFGEEFCFVGTSLPPNRDVLEDIPPGPLAGKPLVYVSLGTTFNNAPAFYRSCFDAFAGAPWQVLLSTGGSSSAQLGTPPENVILRDFVPQLAVLERADVFITHGGMNSVSEGLYHGVPLVVVPQRGDQYLSGARVAELGAGLTLTPRSVTSQSLREAVATVLADPGFRLRAGQLGTSLASAGGCKRAAQEILAFTRRSLPAGKIPVAFSETGASN